MYSRGFTSSSFSGAAIRDRDLDPGAADAVTELGSQIMLDPLAVELTNPGEKRMDHQLGTGMGKQDPPLVDRISGLSLFHLHLVGPAIGSCRGKEQAFAHGPEAQQTDTELSLDALGSLLLQPLLEGIADVGRHVAEVGQALLVQRNALAVVDYLEVQIAPLPSANDGDVAGPRVNAVFHELGDRFEGIVLGQSDDGDGVPVISDAEFPAVRLFPRLGAFGLFLRAFSAGAAGGLGSSYLRLCHPAIIIQTQQLDNTQ